MCPRAGHSVHKGPRKVCAISEQNKLHRKPFRLISTNRRALYVRGSYKDKLAPHACPSARLPALLIPSRRLSDIPLSLASRTRSKLGRPQRMQNEKFTAVSEIHLFISCTQKVKLKRGLKKTHRKQIRVKRHRNYVQQSRAIRLSALHKLWIEEQHSHPIGHSLLSPLNSLHSLARSTAGDAPWVLPLGVRCTHGSDAPIAACTQSSIPHAH